MPFKPLKPCSKPGCPKLTSSRFCPGHTKAAEAEYEQGRGSSSERGYDWRWYKASRMFLAEHPLCVECERQGWLTAATTVDHIIPHKGDQDKFWDEDNWQSLCKTCHDSKTAREDGRWGRGGGP